MKLTKKMLDICVSVTAQEWGRGGWGVDNLSRREMQF